MIATTLDELARVVGGTVHGDGSVVVRGAATVDSRDVEPDGLFVAVAGERVDGHDFAPTALEAGAAATLGSRVVDGPCVVVDDVEVALGLLGASVVDRLTGCTVVGITGSQGKTSTKDLLAQLLETAGPTVATRGNLNNELGVPLTLTRADETTRFLVVEMGARGLGNIAYLCGVAHPSVGVVLNVGTAHIGEFGSREVIAQTKGELVEALPADGTAVISADDALVAAMASRTRASLLRFGRGADADVRASDVAVDDEGRPTFVLEHAGERRPVRLPLLGEHQADNAAAAAAAALAVGLDLETVARVLGGVESRSAWRMERAQRDDGVVVVNDAYNANPESMRSALRTLATMAERRRGRGWAVVGEMRELGADADAEHAGVGRLAAELGLDLVVVGAEASAVAAGARDAGDGRGEVVLVPDVAAAVDWLAPRLSPVDAVLVKASRTVGLERAASGLLDAGGHTAAGASPASPDLDAPHGPGHDAQNEGGHDR
ncbi:UDP-N-acetylmuramoyl-tripeptide--D-alanyl-D-alanine ligase [Solicola sp. PLA-1-18]|uniref:UDP-N-acetylmuramoyl-tripeptide--D-alanyl-D- alanine ligase n=1 Tax=Solicola sp. PLA-1-18 TaxID=3380532 RepID=UPI003B802D11